MISKDDYIQQLDLKKHETGGWFKEFAQGQKTYFIDEGSCGIYRYAMATVLLDSDNPVKFHKIKHEELWFYHDGMPVTIHCIDSTGLYSTKKLGRNLSMGEVLQYKIPKNTTVSIEVLTHDSFGLVSCVVPADNSNLQMLERQELMEQYPQHVGIIKRLTPAKI